jgi:hypothetical protein
MLNDNDKAIINTYVNTKTYQHLCEPAWWQHGFFVYFPGSQMNAKLRKELA